ncbi:hypothetical protein Ahy_B06g080070 [Arachis hypogaea]|uniref:Sm domain-containing protein n=1 Tax=Arachis hypogaea TaxID=3818 RepID=A0A444YH01_ARAHY|nr:hypothetical protein Ahy_B06g080070 [Arachis hypogaea]
MHSGLGGASGGNYGITENLHIYVYVYINLSAWFPFSTALSSFVLKMLFFSYFKDLVGREVTVELKNDLAIRGTLHSVDQYLNIKLENTRVVDQDKYPHMGGILLEFGKIWEFMNLHLKVLPPIFVLEWPEILAIDLSVRNCFIRGSVVRYVQLPPEGVDVELLHDATRREARGG